MNIRTLYFIGIFTTLSIVHACGKQNLNSCNLIIEVPITSVEIPDSVKSDSILSIPIKYLPYNSCSNFIGINSFYHKDTISVHVMVEVLDCNCPMAEKSIEANVVMVPAIKGTYIFRFWHITNLIFQDTLIVY